MMRTALWIAWIGLSAAAAPCAAEEPVGRLPKPEYHPEASDPAWLAAAVQFHGHLGPWAVAGLRGGMTGLRAVDAEGYFDVEVEVRGPLQKPPRSCFLDGVQVSTGATLGKRNIRWTEDERLALRVKNTKTGAAVEIRPTGALVEMLGSFRPQPLAADHHGDADRPQADHGAEDHDADGHHGDDHDTEDAKARQEAHARLERIARKIARAPAGEIFEVERLPSF
jgi:hypothetical protein